MDYLKNTVIPAVEGKFGEDSFKNTSQLTQEDYYASNLTVTVDEELTLRDESSSQETEEGEPEAIEIEGKKVIALYRNLQGEEFDASPPSLRLIGDFMLELPEEEYPATADEGHENFYDCVNAMTYSPCLNNTSLEPGESKDGELFFEIPDELAQGEAPLYIAVSLGNRMVYYPLS